MKKKLKKFLAVALAIVTIASSEIVPTTTNAMDATAGNKTDFGLSFGANGKFTVLQLADIQSHYPVKQKELDVITRAVASYNPDLIVLTGDNVYSPSSEEQFREMAQQIIDCFDNTPFVVTFGNHDSEDANGPSRQKLYDIYKEYGALDFDNNFSDVELNGVGTGNVPILASDGSGYVAYNIVLFDSGTYDSKYGYGKPGYNDTKPYTDEDGYNAVVNWFTNMNEAMKDYTADGDYAPTLAFQHIALQEFYTSGILKEVSSGTAGAIKGYDATDKDFGSKYYIPNPDNATVNGELNEGPCCSASDTSALYKALAGPGNVKGLFFGHDHKNSVMGEGTVNYDGVDYTLVQGYCKSATDSDYNDGTQNVRVFELNESTGGYTTQMVERTQMPPVAAAAPELVTGDALYEDYDIVEYDNLNVDASAILTNAYAAEGANVFTYNRQSPTGSAVLKYRWTVGTKAAFHLSFDEVGGQVSYMFGARLKAPYAEYPNGEFYLRPSYGQMVNLPATLESGKSYDVEYARLKVKSGEHAGKYYMYFKINDVLIAEDYVAADVVGANGDYSSKPEDTATYNALSGKIFLAFWSGTGDIIGATQSDVEPDVLLAPYDTVTLADLGLAGTDWETSVAKGEYSYAGTSATHSVVVKFGWEPHFDGDFKVALDEYWNGKCTAQFNNDAIRFRVGEFERIKINKSDWNTRYEVEFGRLRVLSGKNAGKDWVYLKLDGKVVAENYTNYYQTEEGYVYNDSGDKTTMSYKVCFPNDSTSLQRFSGFAAGASDSMYYAYDEIGYDDLKDENGNSLESTTTVNGSHKVFTYNKTSETGSVILKYRWKVGSVPKFQLSFDRVGTDTMSYMFGVQLDQESEYSNGRMWLRPAYGPQVNLPTALATGTPHDVEFARLKVKSGEKAEQYYVYIKIDDVLIAESYVAADIVQANGSYNCTALNSTFNISNEILFTCWGSDNNVLSAIPVTETYEAYDELAYSDLSGSGVNYTYNATSPSKSAILKFRWTVGSSAQMHLSFDRTETNTSYMFGAWLTPPDGTYTNGKMWLRPAYGPEVNLPTALAAGSTHDVEFARLKVATGENIGKYYMYIKIDGVLIAEDYVAADVVDANGNYTTDPGSQTVSLSNEIVIAFWGSTGASVSDIPNVETYDTYDVVEYYDLSKDGEPLKTSECRMYGENVFTYEATSPSKSAILKYRWVVGSAAKFLLSFDKAASDAPSYQFGAWLAEPDGTYANGNMYLRPSYGQRVNLSEIIEPYSTHDIEFARLKVVSGKNTGKYYMYIKIDGELVGESYVAADVVSSSGTYTTDPNNKTVALSNEIFLAFWGTNENKIASSATPYYEHCVSYYANGKLVAQVPFDPSNPTVEGKEPEVPQIPNATGVWEEHPVSGFTRNITVNAIYTVNVPSASTDIALTEYAGAEIGLNTEIIENYLTTEVALQTAFVKAFNASADGYQDHQNTSFDWTDNGDNSTYTVYFADNTNFENAYIVTTDKTSLINEIGIFVPGKTYYWFVCGNDTGLSSAVDSFTVKDTPVRYITAGGIINMRDLGGRVNSDGVKVRYGLLYRGASLDDAHSYVDDTTRDVFNYLGIKSEIELRGGMVHDYTGWDENNSNVHYIQGANYQEIFELNSEQKEQYKATFEAMADESNYPFYFHCTAGADRTGTLAFLLYGMMGMSYEDIRPEYELTSFSPIGLRAADLYSSNLSMDGTYSQMLADYGDGSGNLQAAVENYLINYVGVSASTLDGIKEIMIETDELTPEPKDYTITSGSNQSVHCEDAVFVSDAEFDLFVKVQVDGADVDADNYTVEAGSAKVILKKEFVETLSVGEHTLNIVFEDGTAAATFAVEGHTLGTKTTKATTAKAGKIETYCKACGEVTDTETIKKIGKIKLSATEYTYNGKAKKPSVSVKDSANKTISSKYYTVKYATGRKNVGKYKVVITFKTRYSGTKTLYFTINPPKTKVSKATGAKKALKITVSKQKSQVSGYQIQYSSSSKFKSAKTKTQSGYKNTTVTIKSLKAKKTYYVRVRTYKTVGGKKYYSDWSTVKKCKTK